MRFLYLSTSAAHASSSPRTHSRTRRASGHEGSWPFTNRASTATWAAEDSTGLLPYHAPVPALLEVSRLAVHYPLPGALPVAALADASLDVAAGEVVGLLGESGAGKTTLHRRRPRPPPRRRARVGIDPACRARAPGAARKRAPAPAGQGHGARPPGPGPGAQPRAARRSAGRGDRPRPRGRERRARPRPGPRGPRVRGAAGRRRYDAYPHQLSGGQRQRVTIAQALCCRPALLLADEPTAALDSVSQAELRALLAGLRARHGLALLLVSHDVGLVSALADRVVVLAGGRTVEAGPVSSVLRAPRDPYTRALLAAVPRAGACPWRLTRSSACGASAGSIRRGGAGGAAVTALDGIDLDVGRGESLALVGRSGRRQVHPRALPGPPRGPRRRRDPVRGTRRGAPARRRSPRVPRARAARAAGLRGGARPAASTRGAIVAEPLEILGRGTPRRARAGARSSSWRRSACRAPTPGAVPAS